MKKYNIKEIKMKSLEDLIKELKQLRESLAIDKLQFKVNPPKDTNMLIKTRKKIAQIMTVINEKKFLSNK